MVILISNCKTNYFYLGTFEYSFLFDDTTKLTMSINIEKCSYG